MRERAVIIGAALAIKPARTGGVEVRLEVPTAGTVPDADSRSSTRILVADDHEIVRRGLKLVMDREPDLEVVAEAADGAEARRARSRPTTCTSRSSTSACPA